MLLQGIGDEQQPVFEAEGAGVGHPLDQEVPRVLERGEVLGIGAWRDLVAIAGGTAAQVLVRPFVVVLAAEAIEGALLGGDGAPGWADGTGFQRLVHAFVGRVFLGARRADPLVLDAQAHPPDVDRKSTRLNSSHGSISYA